MSSLPKTINQIYGIKLFTFRLETQDSANEQGV
jgi:hypothetical protein